MQDPKLQKTKHITNPDSIAIILEKQIYAISLYQKKSFTDKIGVINQLYFLLKYVKEKYLSFRNIDL